MNQCPVTEKGNINSRSTKKVERRKLEKVYCKTTVQRKARSELGPYELLDDVRGFIDKLIIPSERAVMRPVDNELIELPNAIIVGYYLLQQLVKRMGEKVDGCDNKEKQA